MKNIHQVIALIGLASAMAFSNLANAENPVRVWVDQSGKHSVKGTFVEVRDGVVYILKKDGKKMSIKLSGLSEKDVEYIEKASVGEENSLRKTPPKPPQVKPLPVLDLAQAQEVKRKLATVTLDGEPRQLKPMGLPGKIAADRAPVVVPIPQMEFDTGKIDAYDNCSAPISVGSVDAPALGISISNGFSVPGKSAASTNRLVRFDAETGKTATIWRSPDRIKLHDHHTPSGRSLVMVGFNPLGHGGRLAIATGWDQASISIQYEREFPNDESLGKFPHVRWARMIDDECAVAVVDQDLIGINMVSGKVLYSIRGVSHKCLPDISGGRRYLAIPFVGGVDVIDTIDGEALGRIPTGKNIMPSVKFSPIGHALAIVTPRRLRVWGLEEGTLLGEVESRRSLGSREPIWIDHDLVMSSSGILLSIFRGLGVWRYEMAGVETCNAGDHIAVLRKHPTSGLTVRNFPHEGAIKAMQWVDTIKETPKPKTWRVPGYSTWAENKWADRDMRISKLEEIFLR